MYGFHVPMSHWGKRLCQAHQKSIRSTTDIVAHAYSSGTEFGVPTSSGITPSPSLINDISFAQFLYPQPYDEADNSAFLVGLFEDYRREVQRSGQRLAPSNAAINVSYSHVLCSRVQTAHVIPERKSKQRRAGVLLPRSPPATQALHRSRLSFPTHRCSHPVHFPGCVK